MATAYCFDTSAFLEAYRRHYPMDVFPTLWTKLERLIDSGHVVSPELVREELARKDDDMAKWAKARKSMFLAIDDEVQKAVSEVLAQFPRLVDTVRGRSTADPFVVALARIRGATLVSHERPTFGNAERPRIPNACDHFGVRHLNIVDFMREQRWQF